MSMGYMGYALLYQTGNGATPTSPVLLLATGASVNLTIEPINSASVWGQGWYNAATSSHYADAALRYEGNIDVELEGTNEAWNIIRDWGIEWRAYPRSCEISPDGRRKYKFYTSGTYSTPAAAGNSAFDNFGAWCTSLGFSTSEGSFLTCSVGVIALHRQMEVITGSGGHGGVYADNRLGITEGQPGFSNTVFNTYPLNPNSANISPIPFWRTNANLLDLGTPAFPTYPTYVPFVTAGTKFQSDLDTVEWSVDATNNQVILYTCSGTREAKALLMGAMDSSASVTLFSPSGVFDPILGPTGTEGNETEPYIYAQRAFFRVEIQRSPVSATPVYIELPAVYVESDDYSLKGQSDVCNRGFTLHGLGGRVTGGTTLLPPVMMSLAS